MVGILLITHAPLGRAFIEAVTHVYKDPPQRVEALDVIADQDPAEVLSMASDAIKRINDGSGVLVLTDVLGATPANCTQSLCVPGEIEVIAGVSLPMLLRAISYRNNTLETLTEMALTGGQKGVCRVAGKT
ncbi:MAG: PTS fructose transporter subunit IIA [Oxalobacteraceae bacterium]|jgi:PTS system mannose-specific IIA component|nr:PTS fructose transporter subunit IIA [Oxalobacteraceae bacterium]